MTEEKVAPVSLTPGTRLGSYEVVKLVGHGGFGYLYRVVRDGRAYALKISRERPIDLDDEFRADWLSRLDREVAALKTLNHPNIVRIHSFDWYPTLHDGYPYIVMDLVEGETLTEWRREKARSLREVVQLMAGVCDAVGHIHDHGLIHRDLKPANIMVRETGEPVVVDFGIARAEHAAGVTAAGWSIGTITFFAPEYAHFLLSEENADGQAFEWTPATDLHALGFITYELLTTRGPFGAPKQDGGDTAVYETIRSLVPMAPSIRTDGLVPPALDAVVMKLLEKKPEDRYQSAAEVAAAFRGLLEGAGPEWDRSLPAPSKRRAAPVVVRTNVAPKAAPVAMPAAASAAPPTRARPQMMEAVIEPSPAREEGSGRGAVAFEPPSVVQPRMTGLGRAPARPAAEPEDAVPVLATEVRKSLEQLEPKRSGMSTLTKVLIGGGVAVVALFVAMAVVVSNQPKEAQKIDLLKKVEREARERAAAERLQEGQGVKRAEPETKPVSLAEDAAPPAPRPGQEVSPTPAPAPPPPAAPTVAPEQGSGARVESRPRPAPRTPVAGSGTRTPPQAVAEEVGGGLQRSTRIGGAPKVAKAAESRLGVPLGSHMRVKLLSNLDSRTLGNAPIEATLVGGFFVGETMVLAPRTMFYGVASVSGGRFIIEFTRAKLPDNSEAAIQAVAMEYGDGKPGLRAARSIVPEKQEGPGVGSRIARMSAGTAVAATPLGGGVGGLIAKSAAGEAVTSVGTGVEESSTERAILLDAPVTFDLYAVRAF